MVPHERSIEEDLEDIISDSEVPAAHDVAAGDADDDEDYVEDDETYYEDDADVEISADPTSDITGEDITSFSSEFTRVAVDTRGEHYLAPGVTLPTGFDPTLGPADPDECVRLWIWGIKQRCRTFYVSGRSYVLSAYAFDGHSCETENAGT
jgi:hypothetical protein